MNKIQENIKLHIYCSSGALQTIIERENLTIQTTIISMQNNYLPSSKKKNQNQIKLLYRDFNFIPYRLYF